MAYQIEYAYMCHMGRVRANNEDNFWCCGEILPSENQGLAEICAGRMPIAKMPALAVFDGMGGESCGEMAAYLAAEEFGRYYEENKKTIKKDASSFIREACRSMNQAVCSYGVQNKVGSMGSTLAMAVFAPDRLYIGNLGDSRIYHSLGGQFHQISSDHVVQRSMFGKAPLTQYLGIFEEEMALEPWVAAQEYKPGSRYLLCSDGMTDMLTDGEIADILTRDIPVKEAVEILLERALKKGGRDNVTIILCEVREQDKKGPFRLWMEKYKKEKYEGELR